MSSTIAECMNPSGLNHQNKKGDTALILAAEQGFYDIVKTLLENQTDMNLETSRKNTQGNTEKHITALDAAKNNNRHDTIKLLEQHSNKMGNQSKQTLSYYSSSKDKAPSFSTLVSVKEENTQKLPNSSMKKSSPFT